MANTFWQNAFVRPANRLVLRKTAAAKRGHIDVRHLSLGMIKAIWTRCQCSTAANTPSVPGMR
jgi:hypothetical protein